MPGSGGPWRAVACEWERSEEGSRGWDGVQSEEVHLKKKKTNIYFWCNPIGLLKPIKGKVHTET